MRVVQARARWVQAAPPAHLQQAVGGSTASRCDYNLRHVKLVRERAFADHNAAKAFPAELVSLIEEKGFVREQVFNADETDCFGKRC